MVVIVVVVGVVVSLSSLSRAKRLRSSISLCLRVLITIGYLAVPEKVLTTLTVVRVTVLGSCSSPYIRRNSALLSSMKPSIFEEG